MVKIQDVDKLMEMYSPDKISYDMSTTKDFSWYQWELQRRWHSTNEDEMCERNWLPRSYYKTASLLPRMMQIPIPQKAKEWLIKFYKNAYPEDVLNTHMQYVHERTEFKQEISIKHEDSNIRQIYDSIYNFITKTHNSNIRERKISTATYWWFMAGNKDFQNPEIEWTKISFNMINSVGKNIKKVVECQTLIDDFNKRLRSEDHKKYHITTKPSAHGWEFKVVLSNTIEDKLEVLETYYKDAKTCQVPENAASYARWMYDMIANPCNGIGAIYWPSGKIEWRFVFRIMYSAKKEWWDAWDFKEPWIVLDRLYSFHSFADKVKEYAWQIPYELIKKWYNVWYAGSFSHWPWEHAPNSSWSEYINASRDKMKTKKWQIALRTPARSCHFTMCSYYQDSEVTNYTDKESTIKVDFVKRDAMWIFIVNK